MIITCENCSTRFTLDESLLKPEGSKVRCSRCHHVFTAFPPAQELELPPEPAPETDLPEFDTIEEPDLPDSDPEPDFQDLAFDTDFEDVDFDQGLDFDEADLSFESDADGEGSTGEDDETNFDETEFDGTVEEIEFESPETDAPGLEMSDGPEEDASGDEFDAPEGEDGFPDLEMASSDESFDTFDASDELEELQFEELELEESQPDDDGADIEISFDEDEAPSQDLASLSLEMEEEPDAPDDIDFETEDLTFEAEDLEFEDEDAGPPPSQDLEMEESRPGDQEVSAEETLEPDLELSFEDDLEMEDIEFDDPAPSDEQDLDERDPDDQKTEAPYSAPPQDEDTPAFPELEEFRPQETSKESQGLTDDLDDDLEEDLERGLEDEKFSQYDQVLAQDTEPENDFPELDEELNDPAVSPPEKETPPAPEPQQILEKEPVAGPLIEPPPATDGGKRRRKKRKNGISAPVKILALLFLLVIAAYLISLRLGISIPFLDQVNIPFITQAFKPAPPPVTAIGPIPNDASTNGRFVTNATAGRLFIVTGKVDNPDKVAYSQIRIKGTLLTKGNKKAATQIIYCGNVIAEKTLKSGNISDITRQLNVKEGMQGNNLNIKPGQSVRFMLVFSSLPENLTNFTVEVLDYKPAGPQ